VPRRPSSPADQILARRLLNQGLAAAPFDSPAEVVRRLGAVQAQLPVVARWSLGQRMRDGDDAVVERALADGSIVRTHALRPTWHYVAREDVRWVLELTSPRVKASLRFRHRWLGLDDATTLRAERALAKALAGGRHLTRAELAPVIARAKVEPTGERVGHLLLLAELDGVICSGAPRGRHHTYALVDERAPGATRLEKDEALAALTRRYFTSHGPATVRDFRWWSSLTAAEVKRGLEIVGESLAREELDGRIYWSAPEDGSATTEAVAAHLLQEYDELLVGYTESRDVMHPIVGAEVTLAGMALLQRTVLLDGRIAGHWRSGARPGDVEITPLKPFRGAKRAAVEAACERYRAFVSS
jgi:hypothetical protein